MTDQSADPPAGWHPDPHQRHEQRYWDGIQWTDQVADGGQVGTDPVPSGTPAAGQVQPAPVTGPGSPLPPGVPAGSGGTSDTNWGPIIGIGAAVVAVIVLVVVLTGGGGGAGGLGPGDSRSGSVDEDEEATFEIAGDGEEVTIAVEGLDGFDPTVAVEDSSGDEIAFDDDGGDDFDSELEVTLDEGESYEILVSGFDGEDGEFRLSVS